MGCSPGSPAPQERSGLERRSRSGLPGRPPPRRPRPNSKLRGVMGEWSWWSLPSMRRNSALGRLRREWGERWPGCSCCELRGREKTAAPALCQRVSAVTSLLSLRECSRLAGRLSTDSASVSGVEPWELKLKQVSLLHPGFPLHCSLVLPYSVALLGIGQTFFTGFPLISTFLKEGYSV